MRWIRWHCPSDTGFEIRALAVWGRARYLSVTEAPHYTDFHTWMGRKHFCFFETAETGNRTPNSGVKGRGANHYPRAPALNIVSSNKITLSFSHLLDNMCYCGMCFHVVNVCDIEPTLVQRWVHFYTLSHNLCYSEKCFHAVWQIETPNSRLYPAIMTRWPNVGLLLGQRRRRWPNSKPKLDQRHVCWDRCRSLWEGGEDGLWPCRSMNCVLGAVPYDPWKLALDVRTVLLADSLIDSRKTM